MKIDRIIKELFRQSIGLPEVNDAGDYEVEVIYLNRKGRLATTEFSISAIDKREFQESILKKQWINFSKNHCFTVDGIVEMHFKDAA